jgi:AcrR family transcriptional regulator
MPRKKSPQSDRYHHGNLRAALLVTARQLLEENGVSALNLREIARRVGVTAPSAYHHFSGLEAIATALAELGFEELAQQMEAAPTNEKGRLMPSGLAYIAFARSNPALYRLMFGERFAAKFVDSDSLKMLRLRAYERVKSGLEKRVSTESIAPGALFLWSLIHGLALLTIDGQLRHEADPEAMIISVLRLAGTGLPPS